MIHMRMNHKAWTFLISDEEQEIAPERRDEYLNVEILLPRWEKIARGKVMHWKHNDNGNPLIDQIRFPSWIHILK